jgi:hypothetical protein
LLLVLAGAVILGSEECRLLASDAAWLLLESTFRRKAIENELQPYNKREERERETVVYLSTNHGSLTFAL